MLRRRGIQPSLMCTRSTGVSETKTAPKPATSWTRPLPTGSLATTRPVRGSTRSMASKSMSATQTEPKPSPRPTEEARTPVTVPVGLFVRGSIRVTTPMPDATARPASAAATACVMSSTLDGAELAAEDGASEQPDRGSQHRADPGVSPVEGAGLDDLDRLRSCLGVACALSATQFRSTC